MYIEYILLSEHYGHQLGDCCQILQVGELVFWSAHDIMTSVTGSDISLPWQRAKIRLWALKPAGKAADTVARRSKSSRQLKQKFSHTRKTPKNEAVDNC